MDRRPELQPRTRTLWEQLTKPDPAIRDLLKIPHDDDAERRPCTLVDTIGRERRGERGGGGGMITLIDAIGRESRGESGGALMDAIGRDIRGESGGGRGMINWKPLRGRLRLRRGAIARSTPTTSRRADEDGSEESRDEAPAAASTSLMALLEQADSQWEDDDEKDEDGAGGGASKSSSIASEDDVEDSEGREDEEEAMVRACCVCTVRHKGAAFIPCGHTFCRLCSRELWLARASCPLCNAFIHDILHIF